MNTYRFESNDLNSIVGYLDGKRFNFVDYLKDAKQGILATTEAASKWSCNYEPSSLDSFISDADTAKPMQRALHELDYDAEEYLLNLNIFASSLNDPVKSSRNTMQLFAKDNDSALEDNIDFDLSSLTESKRDTKHDHKPDSETSSKRRVKKFKKIKQPDMIDKKSLTKENILVVSTQSNLKKRERMKTKRRERANDFYFLSFDNELSDSSNSSSASSHEDEIKRLHENKQLIHTDNDEEDDEDDDDEFTATSVSSSNTLNNEMAPVSLSADYRQQLIEYLFSNEENNKLFLNGNLASFLDALDTFFDKNSLSIDMFEVAHVNTRKNSSSNELNTLCDQILKIYNELFTLKSDLVDLGDSKQEEPVEVDGLTHFPDYATNPASMITSVQSASDNLGQNESSPDIGPFLSALFNRLDHMLRNSLQINFLLTGIFSKLAYYPQLLLRSFLLNHNLVVQANVKTLVQVIEFFYF